MLLLMVMLVVLLLLPLLVVMVVVLMMVGIVAVAVVVGMAVVVLMMLVVVVVAVAMAVAMWRRPLTWTQGRLSRQLSGAARRRGNLSQQTAPRPEGTQAPPAASAGWTPQLAAGCGGARRR